VNLALGNTGQHGTLPAMVYGLWLLFVYPAISPHLLIAFIPQVKRPPSHPWLHNPPFTVPVERLCIGPSLYPESACLLTTSLADPSDLCFLLVPGIGPAPQLSLTTSWSCVSPVFAICVAGDCPGFTAHPIPHCSQASVRSGLSPGPPFGPSFFPCKCPIIQCSMIVTKT
jgi:hypothetical protein